MTAASADVTLIMPAWHPRREWLEAAVRSALDEPPELNLELIIVDDGSPEPVEDLLTGTTDPRLRILRVPHGGAYAARNAGIAAATGRFLRFLDADDVSEPGSTGLLLDLASRRPGAIPYGDTILCDEDLRPTGIASSLVTGDASATCVLGGFNVYVVSMLFPADVVAAAGPWEESAFSVSGDWDFVLRAVEQAPVVPLGMPLTHYRRNRDSITMSADVAAGASAGELIIDRYLDRNPELRGSDLERRARLRLHLDRARSHAWRREFGPAWDQSRAALRQDPGRTAVAGAAWVRDEAIRVIRSAARRGVRPLRNRG